MSVNTKTAPRRELRLTSLAELSAELDRIQAAHDAGTLDTSGNWNPGQILEHIAILMECAIDGFPSSPPAPVRWILILLFKKKALKGGAPPAGFKIPKQAAFLVPGEATTFDEGMARLRRVIARVREGGERFTHDSPVFGRLTHDQWETLQCGHASLHLGFMAYDGA